MLFCFHPSDLWVTLLGVKIQMNSLPKVIWHNWAISLDRDECCNEYHHWLRCSHRPQAALHILYKHIFTTLSSEQTLWPDERRSMLIWSITALGLLYLSASQVFSSLIDTQIRRCFRIRGRATRNAAEMASKLFNLLSRSFLKLHFHWLRKKLLYL